MIVLVIALIGMAALAPIPARAEGAVCSLVEGGPGPRRGTVAYTRQLVRWADVIVRARALRPGSGARALVPPRVAGLGTPRAVEFEVLEVLKAPPGWVAPRPLYLPGILTEENDFNRDSVPYTFVRPDGARGGCVATAYRRGGEFLLLLQSVGGGWYTPYWALLSPTNEQVHGPDDPWVRWVRARLRPLGARPPGA